MVYLDLGIFGASLSVIIQAGTNFLIIYIIVHCFGYGKVAIQPFTKEALKGWGDSFKKGVPTYFMQLFAFIAIEFVVLFSGVISVEILASNTALVNLLYLMFLYVY